MNINRKDNEIGKLDAQDRLAEAIKNYGFQDSSKR